MNIWGTDQAGQMCRLICTSAVSHKHLAGFLVTGLKIDIYYRCPNVYGMKAILYLMVCCFCCFFPFYTKKARANSADLHVTDPRGTVRS